MPLPNPPFIPEPFANAAAGSYITNPIPDTTGAAGAASWRLGFPPVTMTPEVGGGQPPFGQDFNGVLFAISSHLVYLEQGLLYQFSATVASAIGGYAVGTILLSSDGNTVWYNKAAANSTDPDGATPAGWVPLYSYGITTVAVTTGTVTLSAAQAAKAILKITGNLTGNVVVVLPAQVQQWLVVNATTGAFNVTVKTAAGTGVVIPQSGATAPSTIYGDATNIYLTSISTAGLAPLASPAFTGTPTAPTPSLSSNTTQLATTAFVRALLGGSVISFRTGTYNIVGNVAPGTVNFGTPFPNACLGVVTSVPSGGFQPGSSGYTAAGFTPNGNACGTQLATYLAWGN